MAFWDTSNAEKPTGIKDPNAVLDYPVSFAAWLSDVADTYASHSVIIASGSIVCDSSTQSAGVITPIISGGTVGETASFTIRITTTAGRVDDRTFYLKIKER